jgi:threonine/homoserine/homoserine lactone efflux protein
VSELLGLLAFAFVSTVTPGPNNVLLWASGVQFGFRATLPHVFGTALGIGLLAAAAAGGIAALLAAVPGSEVALKVAGSAYLAWLTWHVAAGGGVDEERVARPLGLAQAIAFQFVNPKAWLFALAAVSTYRIGGLPVAAASAVVVLAMTLVVVPSAALWAAGGTALRPFMGRRWIDVVLAAMLAASIALIWV